MQKFFKKINKNNSGFTLVETLVAISIFTTSILVMISILAQSIANTEYAKQKIIATYLAQEGIEYMRNMRDTFVLYTGTSAAGWTAFNSKLTTASCQNANGCYFDDQNLNYSNHSSPVTGITLTACADTTCSTHPLLYDSTIGKYGYAGGTASVFTRQIKMTQASADEIKISSTVYWKQNSGTYNVTFSEDVFNWVE